MHNDKPFLIDCSETEPENHIAETENEAVMPFEFSKTNIWNDSFFAGENMTDTSFDTLYAQLDEIKTLINDIKHLLSSIFETKKDLET